MQSYDVLMPIAVVVVFGLAIGLTIWHFIRARELLEQWARAGGYTIIEAEQRYLRRGPFFWRTSRGQVVYYVVVRDSSGDRRAGWVRLGGWFLGLLSDQADVIWEY